MLLLQVSDLDFDSTTIVIVWSVALVLALIVTLIDVMLLVRVIRAARKIDQLAGITLTAAGGIASNTAAIKNLAATNEVATALIQNALPIVRVAESLESKLSIVAKAFSGRRS